MGPCGFERGPASPASLLDFRSAAALLQAEFPSLPVPACIYLNLHRLEDSCSITANAVLITPLPGSAEHDPAPLPENNTELLDRRPGMSATNEAAGCGSTRQTRNVQTSTTRTTTPCDQLCCTRTTTTPGVPRQRAQLVFALPGMRPRCIAWDSAIPLREAIWPLLCDFVHAIPNVLCSSLAISPRTLTTNDGTPILLVTVDHPDILCRNVWLEVRSTPPKLQLVAAHSVASVAGLLANHCPTNQYWDVLVNGARAGTDFHFKNGTLVTVVPDWTTALSQPTTALFMQFPELDLLQFAFPIPAVMASLPPAFFDATNSLHVLTKERCRKLFLQQWDQSAAFYSQHTGFRHSVPTLTVAIPNRGLCKLGLRHQISPSAPELRQRIKHLWQDLISFRLLDTKEVLDDSCLYLIQEPGINQVAWLRCHAGSVVDVTFLQFGLHPSSCIPHPAGFHVQIIRTHGAWGFYAYVAGPLQHFMRRPLHMEAITAWEDADSESSSHGIFDSPMDFTSDSDETPQLNLLQKATRILKSESASKAWVWRINFGPVLIHVSKSASMDSVAQSMLDRGVTDTSQGLVPLYPQQGKILQRIARDEAEYPDSVPAVISPNNGTPFAMALPRHWTAYEVAAAAGHHNGHVSLNQKLWHSSFTGFFAGMRLEVKPWKTTVSKARSVPTPCRNATASCSDLPHSGSALTARPLALDPLLRQSSEQQQSVTDLHILHARVAMPWYHSWQYQLPHLQMPASMRAILSADRPPGPVIATHVYTDGSSKMGYDGGWGALRGFPRR